MAFQPQEEALRQLSYALRDSLSGYDRVKQKDAEQVRLISLLIDDPLRRNSY